MDLSHLNTAVEAPHTTDNIPTIIDTALDMSVPWITPRPRPAPWWNPHLNQLACQVLHTDRRHCKDPSNPTVQAQAKEMRNQ
jgi:hypothetical protein